MMKKLLLKTNKMNDIEVQRLSKHLKLPLNDTDRMFKLSEIKLEDMKKSENFDGSYERHDNTECFEVLTSSAAPVWSSFLRYAAAVAVIVAAGGSLVMLHAVVPGVSDNYVGSVETYENAANDNGAEEKCYVSEAEGVASTAESQMITDSSADETSRALNKSALDSSAESPADNAESKSESGNRRSDTKGSQTIIDSRADETSRALKKSALNSSAASPAENAESKSASGTGRSNTSDYSNSEKWNDESVIDDREAAESSAEVGSESSGAGKRGSGEDDEEIHSAMKGITSEERLKMVTGSMTVREAIEILGEPEFFDDIGGDSIEDHSENDIAYYTTDDYNTMLFIEYDTLDDKALDVYREVDLMYDGSYDSNPWFFVTKSLTSMKSDPENRTFDCVVIDFDPDHNSVNVVCPQYLMFEKAVCRLTDEQTEMLVNSGCGSLSSLRITHSDVIEESYPEGIFAESVDIFK